MRQDIDPELLLACLHEVHVREHAVFGVRVGEFGGYERGGVQAREGDELQDETTRVSDGSQGSDVGRWRTHALLGP